MGRPRALEATWTRRRKVLPHGAQDTWPLATTWELCRDQRVMVLGGEGDQHSRPSVQITFSFQKDPVLRELRNPRNSSGPGACPPPLCPDPVAPETRGVGSHSTYPLGLALRLSTMSTRCGGRGQKAPFLGLRTALCEHARPHFPYHRLTDRGRFQLLAAVSTGTRLGPCFQCRWGRTQAWTRRIVS